MRPYPKNLLPSPSPAQLLPSQAPHNSSPDLRSPPKTPPLSGSSQLLPWPGISPKNSSPLEGRWPPGRRGPVCKSPHSAHHKGPSVAGSPFSERPAHESAFEGLRWHIAVRTSPIFRVSPHNNTPWTHLYGLHVCQAFGNPPELRRPVRQFADRSCLAYEARLNEKNIFSLNRKFKFRKSFSPSCRFT